jgi:TPR repeat protein
MTDIDSPHIIRGQADGESMNQIGRLYEHGLGVGEDRATAISWYRKAATAGSAQARSNLERLGISR